MKLNFYLNMVIIFDCAQMSRISVNRKGVSVQQHNLFECIGAYIHMENSLKVSNCGAHKTQLKIVNLTIRVQI